MPQRIGGLKLSGLAIRDRKVPYVFLPGGNHGDGQEPEGRVIFSLALMLVLIARKVFAPMTWEGGNARPAMPYEYVVAANLLLPASEFLKLRIASLDDVKAASNRFKVTPSSAVRRALDLGMISRAAAEDYFDILESEFEEFRRRNSGSPRSPILPVNAVRKYNGREFTVRMLQALEGGRITENQFCKDVCSKNIGPSDIRKLKAVCG